MSVAPYPEYKDSGVEWIGAVPAHWNVLAIKRLSPVQRGASPRPIDDPRYFDDDGEFAWVRIADVTASDGVLRETTQRLSALGASLSVQIAPGELFISIAGSVGKPCIAGIKACIHDGFVYFPNLQDYRGLLFRIFEAGHCYAGLGKMGTQLNLNTDTIGAIKVPVASPEEQSAIAAFLDQETGKIDALVAEQERLIGLLKEKQRSFIFNFMVNGLDYSVPTKLSGVPVPGYVPEHWEVLPLTRVIRQFVDYRGATPKKIDDGVPLITATQIKDGRIDHGRDPVFISEEEYVTRMTRGFPARGDVLLTTEAPLGEVAQIEDERVAPGQRMILMKADETKIRSDFLFWHFRSDFGRKELWTRASGSTASGIRSDRLRASVVLVPPLEEQDRIIAAIRDGLARFAGVEAEIKQQISLLQERRAALVTLSLIAAPPG
jgi:type I restriction enzyme S subunit